MTELITMRGLLLPLQGSILSLTANPGFALRLPPLFSDGPARGDLDFFTASEGRGSVLIEAGYVAT
jgi:hypothetical protein